MVARVLGVWIVCVAAVAIARPCAADPPPAPAYVRPPPQRLALPAVPGDHKLKFTTRVAGRPVTMSYLLHLPAAYADRRQRVPMLVFLHGIGECGTDLAGVYVLGPMTIFRADGTGQNPAMAATCPFAILCPQCPPRGEKWDDDFIYRATAELVDSVVHSGRVDPDRVYATGLSMGGLGTWCVAEQAPDLFAAVAPLSAVAWQPESAADALRFVSVWTVTGKWDEPRFVDGNKSMQAALAGSPMGDRFSYLDDGHGAYNAPYVSTQFYEWLLAHHRPDAAARKRVAAATPPPIPTAPGLYRLTYDGTVGDHPCQVDYALYIPRLSAGGGNATGKRPAMLSLCDRDAIGPVFRDVCCHGPELAVQRHPLLQDRFPFVVVSPRLPLKCDWTSPGVDQLVLALFDHVAAALPIDPDRVVVTGVDDGATGAWQLATATPQRFSAILWAATRADQGLPGGWDALFARLPGRVFAANNDVRRTIADRARRDRRDWAAAALTPGVSPIADLPIYTDTATIAWLAKQRRATH